MTTRHSYSERDYKIQTTSRQSWITWDPLTPQATFGHPVHAIMSFTNASTSKSDNFKLPECPKARFGLATAPISVQFGRLCPKIVRKMRFDHMHDGMTGLNRNH